MCDCQKITLKFSAIEQVKVLGPKVGKGKPGKGRPMRDADSDGKCQEENGEWVPCPPGVPTGTALRGGKPLGQLIGDIADADTPEADTDAPEVDADAYVTEQRKKASERAQKIIDDAKKFNEDNPDHSDRMRAAMRWDMDDFVLDSWDTGYEWAEQRWDEENPEPEREDFPEGEEGDDEYDEAKSDWDSNREYGIQEIANEANNQKKDEANYQIQKIFNRKFKGKDGREYTVEVFDVEIDDYGSVSMEGEISDDQGRSAGKFSRTFNSNGEVYHNSLFIKQDYQSNGIAAAFNTGNEELYRAMGYHTIAVKGVSGGSMSGAYHWPRTGFDWADMYVRDRFLDQIQKGVNDDRYWIGPDDPQRIILRELLDVASSEDFYSDQRLVAADFTHWDSAKMFFSDYGLSFDYKKDL